MTQYELEILMKIIMGLVALALFGIVCYVFGKSKAEIFPDEHEDVEAALSEAHEKGFEEGYEAALQQIIKKYSKERMYTDEKK